MNFHRFTPKLSLYPRLWKKEGIARTLSDTLSHNGEKWGMAKWSKWSNLKTTSWMLLKLYYTCMWYQISVQSFKKIHWSVFKKSSGNQLGMDRRSNPQLLRWYLIIVTVTVEITDMLYGTLKLWHTILYFTLPEYEVFRITVTGRYWRMVTNLQW